MKCYKYNTRSRYEAQELPNNQQNKNNISTTKQGKHQCETVKKQKHQYKERKVVVRQKPRALEGNTI